MTILSRIAKTFPTKVNSDKAKEDSQRALFLFAIGLTLCWLIACGVYYKQYGWWMVVAIFLASTLLGFSLKYFLKSHPLRSTNH